MKTVDFGANRVQLYSFHKSADEIARERISHLELKVTFVILCAANRR